MQFAHQYDGWMNDYNFTSGYCVLVALCHHKHITNDPDLNLMTVRHYLTTLHY